MISRSSSVISSAKVGRGALSLKTKMPMRASLWALSRSSTTIAARPARVTRARGRRRRSFRHAVARDDPVVVEPQQRDHVADVGLAVDPARRRPLLPGEDRVVDDAALL